MATTEVAEILGLLDFIQEVNVYGVEVPGNKTWRFYKKKSLKNFVYPKKM